MATTNPLRDLITSTSTDVWALLGAYVDTIIDTGELSMRGAYSLFLSLKGSRSRDVGDDNELLSLYADLGANYEEVMDDVLTLVETRPVTVDDLHVAFKESCSRANGG